MNAATFVEHAGELASKMIARETRGPGDVENAMRRLEARYAIPYQALWQARYRRPKQIAAHVYAAIVAAYETECDRQAKLLEHERAITKAKGWPSEAFARASVELVSKENEQ